MNLKIEIQYFPSIISISALNKSLHVDFCAYENWQRRSFRNRTMIATANGILALSIPVAGGRNQAGVYRDIRVDHRGDWQQRHWRSIYSAYGKSPWFFQYADGLEKLYQMRDPFLVDWNLRCLLWLGEVMPWNPGIWLGQDVLKEPLGRSRTEGVTVDLADKITPANYQDPALGTVPVYAQVFSDRYGFQPNLSVLDLLFCCGPQTRPFLENLSASLYGAWF